MPKYEQDGHTLASSGVIDNVNIQYDGQGASKIYIAEAQSGNAGWYQCTAYNIAGSAQTRGRLQIEPLVDLKPYNSQPIKLQIPKGRIIEPP